HHPFGILDRFGGSGSVDFCFLNHAIVRSSQSDTGPTHLTCGMLKGPPVQQAAEYHSRLHDARRFPIEKRAFERQTGCPAKAMWTIIVSPMATLPRLASPSTARKTGPP